MTTAANQSQQILKSYVVMELLYRKDYSESRPKPLIIDSLFFGEFSITKPSESKMSNYDIWRDDGSNNYNSSPKDIITNYNTLLGVHENVPQKSHSPLEVVWVGGMTPWFYRISRVFYPSVENIGKFHIFIAEIPRLTICKPEVVRKTCFPLRNMTQWRHTPISLNVKNLFGQIF